MTCDFCNGLSHRRCSFCASDNRAECHHRRRRSPSLDPANSTSHHPASASSSSARSSWRADLDTVAVAAASGGGGVAAAATSGAEDEREPGRLLPLKRGRFSASPAVGLVGLQENEFLGDFFGCLGFLALTNESTVRGAMVRVMLAGESTRYPHRRHRHRGAPSPFQPSPARCQGRVGEGLDDATQAAFSEISSNVDGSRQSNASAAGSRTRTLPRDTSTCILWCAVALGALVRGYPLAQVEQYADLAEDSVRACRDDATLDAARAYIATAVLHDFLGDRVKTREYLEVANSIVDQLPPKDIPRGFHRLLQYAGMAHTELASAEDVKAYWENATLLWELSKTVAEQDVSGLVLSVSVRVNQPFIDETGFNRAEFAEERRSQPRPSAVEPVVHRLFIEQAEQHDAQSAVGGCLGLPSEKVAVVEEDQVCVSSIVPSSEVEESELPAMLRVQECIERSEMHLGIGGLLYYGGLSYLQAVNKKESGKYFLRAVDVILRYPGLCRFKSWLWIVHSYLLLLAFTKRRGAYEGLRASYNSVLPPGSKAAPPFEECREVSDICDHAYCRKAVASVMQALPGKPVNP